MNASDFLSSNEYFFLPTKKRPKVALAVDNSTLTKNAFKLYNPFSQKAKLLKKVSRLAFTNFNTVSKIVLGAKLEKKSPFVSYLETKLDKPLVVSLYFATINDKIVMQLQTPNAQIIGYLKYPINDIGLRHLENEKKAIDILSERGVIQKCLLYDEFDGKPFLLLTALEGDIGLVDRQQIDDILLQFKREKVHSLSSHPRVKGLKQLLASNDLSKYIPLLENISQKSTTSYALVYEHGDFTPWNIVKVNEDCIPFDFEYFIDDGLEYFDLIKYYYQVGRLLEGKKEGGLVTYISEQIEIEEINELLQLFIVKEIAQNKKENEPYDFEISMIKELEKR
jgi:hypothetical protein